MTNTIYSAYQAQWEVWYRDTFDRECPPSIDVSGKGLVQGLTELWARHLFETIRPGGMTGFSHFHLRWEEGFVNIEGDRQGAYRLREWIFGSKKHTRKGYIAAGDARLLNKLSATHAALLLSGRSSQPILALAAAAKNRKEFEAQIADLRRIDK
jgi:hypothetical protein